MDFFGTKLTDDIIGLDKVAYKSVENTFSLLHLTRTLKIFQIANSAVCMLLPQIIIYYIASVTSRITNRNGQISLLLLIGNNRNTETQPIT